MTITVPCNILLIAGLFCFGAGLGVGNAVEAYASGSSPLPSALGAVISLGLAIYLVWTAARPRQDTVRLTPRPNEPPSA